MAKIIKVTPKKGVKFKVRNGPLTTNLLDQFSNLDKKAKNTLLEEASYLLSNAKDPNGGPGSITGIAIGYVQSGKTMSFTTLTTLAVDSGFRVIVYFAGVKNNLLEQTVERLEKDLQTTTVNSFKLNLLQNPSVAKKEHINIAMYLQNTDEPIVLIAVLKQHTNLKALKELFETTEVRDTLKNRGVLIIDDEADQAGLDSKARKTSALKSKKAEKTKKKGDAGFGDPQTSTTYARILDLKDSIPNHTYIQYTATPQGPLLINVLDMLSPKFHKILTPGESYTGGKEFFGQGTKKHPFNPNNLINTIPENEVYHYKYNPLTAAPNSLVDALQVFLIGVAIKFNIQKINEPLSMMIHADRETDASNLFALWIRDTLGTVNNGWLHTLNKSKKDPGYIKLLQLFKKNYNEAIKNIKSNVPSFQEVMNVMNNVILATRTKVITGKDEFGKSRKKEDLKVKWRNHPSHIIIGAEMLNRGFTVEGLMVSYMPRYSKGTSQADTIQQRCRFFGYKRKYLSSCRVYLPKDSIEEYTHYVEHEEIFRLKLKDQNLREYAQTMVLNPKMRPTALNKLSNDVVKKRLTGYQQVNALQYIQENIIFIKDFIRKKKFSIYKKYNTPYRNHRYCKIEIKELIEFLLDFKLGNYQDTMRKNATIQFLSYQSTVLKHTHAYIIEMGYLAKDARKREFFVGDDSVEINNIFQGGDNEAEKKKNPKNYYPGDREIKFDNYMCIQIHKIEPKLDILSHKERILWQSKVGPQKYIYTLGIYYPEKMSLGFNAIK